VNAILKPLIHNFPVELTRRAAWVVWKGKKVPFDPKEPGRAASSTNPDTWGTFNEAASAYDTGEFAGFGVMLNNDGLVGVDLDKCVGDDGVPSADALQVLDQLGATYVELSPSGRGLRAFGYGDSLPAGVNGVRDGVKAEFYSTARYLTITGHSIKNGAPGPLQDFAHIAQQFRVGAPLPSEATANGGVPMDERYGAWVDQVLSGAVYHDALRDLSASLIGSGATPTATTAILLSIMDAVRVPKDERWHGRRKQIPSLVQSAYAKYAANGFTEAAANASRYSIVYGDHLRELRDIVWRIKRVLPDTGLASVYGPSGSGKTFLCMCIAAAIAEGGTWFNYKVRPVDVIYVALEGEAGIKQRSAAWELHNGRPLPRRLGFLLSDFAIATSQDIADLAEQVPRGGVVFIDTLNRAAPEADENSSADMGRIIKGAKELQRRTEGLVVLVHHTGKDTSKGLRGHSSLNAALDTAIEVSRVGGNHQWRIAKSKDGGDGGTHGFNLLQCVVGHDEDGDTITSCVVTPLGMDPLPVIQPLRAQEQIVFDTFLDAVNREHGVVLTRAQWRRALASSRPDMTRDAVAKAISRAVKELQERGLVAEQEGGFVLTEFVSIT
jgi:RecA/RadA recombinase